MPPGPPAWNPSVIRLHLRTLGTYSRTVQVRTDAGVAYLKAMNDRGSPHDLACEWVGTELAHLVGLPTLDYATIPVPADAPVELAGGAKVVAGPGFITREAAGQRWSGNVAELRGIVNRGDLGRLVAFDTWTLNCDRFRPLEPGGHAQRVNRDNVFLSRDGLKGSQLRLIAMDHGCCFTCQGNLTPASLTRALSDRTLYGMFPEFRGVALYDDAIRLATTVQSITRDVFDGIVSRVPHVWLPEQAARSALVELIYLRSRALHRIIEAHRWSANLFDGGTEEGGGAP